MNFPQSLAKDSEIFSQMRPILCERIEISDAFRFKTPWSILVMGPSGCGKTCLSKSLVLDHLDELFVNPANVIHYCYGALQDGFREMQEEGFKFHESVPEQGQLKKLFPKEGGFLALDVLMTEGGNNKEVLDRFTKHSIITTSPSSICFKTCFHSANMLKVFQGMPITWSLSSTLKNLLL